MLLVDEDNLDNIEVSNELSAWNNLGKYYSNLYCNPIANYYSTIRYKGRYSYLIEIASTSISEIITDSSRYTYNPRRWRWR